MTPERDYKKEWAETIPKGEFCNGCRACFVGVMGHYNCALYSCEILSWRASMITGTLEILKCEKCKERNAGKS